jgi:two-component system, OmpR family, sensor histidine kinase MtrB
VANLVENAEHHGGGLVRLGVRHCAVNRDGQARIEIDDAGPGYAREHVFERFARGATARRDTTSSGAGLGLTLVTQHIHRHGGRVWVEDRPGGGARFVIELPAAGISPTT